MLEQDLIVLEGLLEQLRLEEQIHQDGGFVDAIDKIQHLVRSHLNDIANFHAGN